MDVRFELEHKNCAWEK